MAKFSTPLGPWRTTPYSWMLLWAILLCPLLSWSQVTTITGYSNTTSFTNQPFGPQASLSNFYRSADLYLLPIAGLANGDVITGIEYFHTNNTGASGAGNGSTVPRYQIPLRVKISTTTATTYSAATYTSVESGSTLVYSGFIPVMGKDQWVRIPFSTPFTYTGNNVQVIVETDNPAGATLNDYPFGRIQGGGGGTTHANWSGATPPTSTTASGTSLKPSIRFLKSPALAPSCVSTVLFPANGETGLCPNNLTLKWAEPSVPSGFGIASGYKVYVGTNPQADNLVNGTLTTLPYYALSALSPNTSYNWYVVPTNASGDAVGCSTIYTFTTSGTSVPTATAPFTDDLNSCTGWTPINGLSNRWIQGTAARTGSTGQAFYTSIDNGVSNNYVDSLTNSTTAPLRSWLARTVTFPAGQPRVTLNFDYIAGGDGALNGADVLKVYIAPAGAAITPNIATTALTTAGATLLGTFEEQYTWATTSIDIPNTLIGSCAANSSKMILFVWEANNNTSPVGVGAAVDNISITTEAGPSFPGTFTINPALPESGTNFQSFATALRALNDACSPAGTVFNLPAGTVYDETVQLPAIQVSGASGSPIVFQKSGAGANPVLKPVGSTATTDFAIGLAGADYITFDGLDIDATGADDAVEIGYSIATLAGNGSTNNTIKRCSITLSTLSLTTGAGISQTGLTTGAAQNNNTYQQVRISNTYNGIVVTAVSTLPETGNRVLNCRIGSDVAGSQTGLSGINLAYQTNYVVSGDTVQNLTSSSAVDGITVTNQTLDGEISNNVVRLIRSGSTSTSSGISHSFTTAVTGVTGKVRIFNNRVSDIQYTGATASTTRHAEGITTSRNGGNNFTYEIDFNSVRIESPVGNASACLFIAGAVANTSGTVSDANYDPIFRVRNNNLANFTPAQSGTTYHNCIVIGNTGTATAFVTAANLTINYNNYYIANTTNGPVGRIYTSTTASYYNTLANWQTAVNASTGKDLNSVSTNPIFAGTNNLHAGSAGIDAEGSYTGFPYTSPTTYASVASDFEGDSRVSATSIGADQFGARDVDMAATAILSPVDKTYGCYTNSESVSVEIRNLAGNTPSHSFVTDPVDIILTVTPPSGPVQTYTVTRSTGTLASGAALTINFPTPINMSAGGTYVLNARTETTNDPDAVALNSTSVSLVRSSPLAVPLVYKFTGFTGANLATITAQKYKEAKGVTAPVGTTSGWAGNATMNDAYISAATSTYTGEWIVLPKVTAGANLRLRYRAALGTSTTALGTAAWTGTPADDEFSVKVSTDCGVTWATAPSSAIVPTTALTGTWQLREVNLGGYTAGADLLVGLFYSNNATVSNYYLHVDDVVLFNTTGNDLAVTALAAPVAAGNCFGPNQTVSVTLTNTNASIYSFVSNPVTITTDITGPNPQTLTLALNSGTLAANATQTYVLSTTYAMTVAGTYTFKPRISGDDYAFDDTLSPFETRSVEAFGTLPAVVSFDGYNGTNLPTVFPGWAEGRGGDRPVILTTPGWLDDGFRIPGNVFARLNIAAATAKKDWVVSPFFQLPAGNQYEMRVRLGLTAGNDLLPAPSGGLAGTDDTVSVRISTDCGQTWSHLLRFTSANANLLDNSLQLFTIPLTAYAGQTIKLGVYASEGAISNRSYYVILDDIQVRQLPPINVSGVGIISPTSTSGCYSVSQPVTVRVRNSGTSSLNLGSNPLTINVFVNGPPGLSTISQTFNSAGTTIAPNATMDFLLTSGTANLSVAGQYTLSASATVVGDGDANDNSAGSQVIEAQSRFTTNRALPLTTGFATYTGLGSQLGAEGFYESDVEPLASSTDNESSWTTSSVFGQTTARFPLTTFPSFGNILSNRFQATATTKLEFKFAITDNASVQPAVFGMDGDDKFEVLVSTDCGNTFTAVLTLDSAATRVTNPVGNALRTYTVDLGSYAAASGVIVAFRAYTGVNNYHGTWDNYDMHIDDIRIFNAGTQDLVLETVPNPIAACSGGSTQPIKVRVRNSGTNAWNFASNPVNLSVAVAKARADWNASNYIIDPAYTTLTTTVNTGTLAAGAVQDYTVAASVDLSIQNVSNIPNAQDVTDKNTAGFVFTGTLSSTNDQVASNNSGRSPIYVPHLVTKSIENIFFGYNASTTTLIETSAGGWQEARGRLGFAGSPIRDTASWNEADWNNDPNAANDRSARFYLNANRRHGWLISPTFLATQYTTVSYDAIVVGNGTIGGAGQMGSDDSLKILVSEDCGLNWQAIYAHSRSTNIIPNSGQSYLVSLPASYDGKRVRIAFYATEGTVDDADNVNLFIDNVLINNRFPVNMSVTEIQEPFGVTCKSGTQARLLVKNLGLTPASNFSVTLTLRQAGQPDVVVGPTVISGPLAPNSSMSATVGIITLPNNLPWSVEGAVTIGSDGDLSDNLLTGTTTVELNPAAYSGVTPGAGCINTAITLGSASASTEWYASATGAGILGTGTSYVTPPLSTNTTYYASVRLQNSEVSGAKADRATGASTSTGNGIGIEFQVKRAIYLTGVHIYPGSTSQYTIRITDGENNPVSGVSDILYTPSVTGTKQLVPVNVLLQPGTYRIVRAVNALSLTREVGLLAGGSIVSPDGNITVVRGVYSFANNLEPSDYYGFYDFRYKALGCPSAPRTPVLASILPTGTWRGVNSNGWNDAANWCGGVPTVATDVVIPPTGNNPQVISGVQSANNLSLQTGAVLTVNGTLNVGGNWTSPTTTVGGTGTIIFNGSGAQTVTGNVSFPNLTISNTTASGVAVGANQKVTILPTGAGTGKLELQANAKLNVSAAGSEMILASNGTGTAYLSAVPASASYTGTITQERFVTNSTPAWHFVGTPTVTTDFSEVTDNLVIRGPFPWARQADPDSNHSHVYEHKENVLRTSTNPYFTQVNGWAVPSSSALPSGKGFRIWFGGDFFTSSRAGKFQIKGTPTIANASPFSYPLTYNPATGFGGGGWNLVANPFPAAIDWDAPSGWSRNGSMDNAFYTWNINAYYSYVDGTPSAPRANPSIIPSMQGFFVKAHGASPSVTVSESAKAASGGSFFRTAAQTDIVRMALANSTGQVDYAVVHFREFATKGFDSQYDAYKLPGASVNISSYGAGNVDLTINKRPPLTTSVDSVQVRVTVPAAGAYTITFTELESFVSQTSLYLLDRFDGTQRLVTPGMVFSFNVTADSRSQGDHRFVLIAAPASVTDVKENLHARMFSVYPNPVSQGEQILLDVAGIQGVGALNLLTVEVIDATGHVVHTETFAAASEHEKAQRALSTMLSKGVYVLRLSGSKDLLTNRLVIQ